MKRIGCLLAALILILAMSSTASAAWLSDENGWWWRETNGSCPTSSWKKISNKWYYFDARGYMVTGLQTIDGADYYFNDSGAMTTGWVQINNDWFFFEKSGAMAKNGWSGHYYFDASGKMLIRARTPDGYYVDAAGKWVDFGKVNRAWEEEVVRLTNAFRAENGLSPLAMDESLMLCASIRACELTTSYSHTRPDGNTCFTVLTDIGLSINVTRAENIAMGYRSPQAVVNGWINSPGHRANMLNSSVTKMGAGCYNGRYWVQLFTSN